MTTTPENDNRTLSVLRIDSSAKGDASTSRKLSDQIVAKLKADNGDVAVTLRDVSGGLPTLNEHWVGASYTPKDDRSDDQKSVLALSDALIDEVRAADVLVIGVPVYNFNISATLKTWLDHLARPGESFRYTEEGPEGLLPGKRVILAFASGGVEAGSEIDFVTPYLKFMLGFMGMTDVQVVAADRQNLDETSLDRASAKIGELAA